MATAKKSSKSSTSKSSEKKKAPEKKVEEAVNPVGRPKEIVKLTSNDGLSAESQLYLEKIANQMHVTPAEAVQAMLSLMVQRCRVSGVGGVAAELQRYKGL